jgi:hypothetical protein
VIIGVGFVLRELQSALGFTLWLMWLRRNGNSGVAPVVEATRQA